ncbi:hypothetical protein M6B38_118715 [Iris pallida]|uniref:Uncharacterized protein n=1 Tax=Iris pallida TaxID=29817 RepID=A0AAX6HJC1_IRIPA|nr:hypothetical protein M6B38_118715 [Iris pallida]
MDWSLGAGIAVKQNNSCSWWSYCVFVQVRVHVFTVAVSSPVGVQIIVWEIKQGAGLLV